MGKARPSICIFILGSIIRIPKLNFDVSFIKESTKGGYRGVIRDSLGASLIHLFRIDGLCACNETDVFAMLMGCQKLWKLRGNHRIIEGGSFSAIQWGSAV